jgi:LysR family glycine cleavage system transcriptional activator
VVPFEVSLQVEFGYYLVVPEETAQRPKVAAFRAWVLSEVRDAERGGEARRPRAAG